MATEQEITALNAAISGYLEKAKDRAIIKDYSFVNNEIDFLDIQSTEESFEDVFNSWMRFSRQSADGYDNDAIPSELSDWSYDSIEDELSNTTNSSSYIGFISPTEHEDYVFETTLSSTNIDDDFIGVVAAYAEDEQGNGHTLDVMAQGWGIAPVAVFKNYGVEINNAGDDLRTDLEPNPYVVTPNTGAGLIWMDGASYDGNPRVSEVVLVWTDQPDGIKLRVTRQGDIITVEASEFGSATLLPTVLMTIDLSSDPRLEIFRGPQRFGYSTLSQPNSTWDVISRPGSRNDFIDLRDMTSHKWDGSQWNQTIITDYPDIPDLPLDKAFYYSNYNSRLYYYDSRVGLLNIGSDTGVVETESGTDTPVVRTGCTACYSNGFIYVVGGGDVSAGNRLDRYDPLTDTWTQLTNAPVSFEDACSTSINGKVYVHGGVGNQAVLYEYDPATDAWTSLANSPISRDGPEAVALYGNMYVMNHPSGAPSNNVSVYNPENNAWSTIADGVVYEDGDQIASARGLVFFLKDDGTLKSYNPLTDVWSTLTQLDQVQSVPGSLFIGRYGKLFLFGGTGTETKISTYDIDNDEWSSLADSEVDIVGGSIVEAFGNFHIISGDTSAIESRNFIYEINSIGY